jgi:TonB family protein
MNLGPTASAALNREIKCQGHTEPALLLIQNRKAVPVFLISICLPAMRLRLTIAILILSSFVAGQEITNDNVGFQSQYQVAVAAAQLGSRDRIRASLDGFALPAEWFQQTFGSAADEMQKEYSEEFDYFKDAEAHHLLDAATHSGLRFQAEVSPETIYKAPEAAIHPLPRIERVIVKNCHEEWCRPPQVSWMNLFTYVDGSFRFAGIGASPFWLPARLHRPDTCDPQQHQPGGQLNSPLTPQYPEAAKQQGIQGSVRLRTDVARDGSVSGVNVLSGDPALAQPAAEAARQWHYQPFMNCGQPIVGESIEEVRYSLVGSTGTVSVSRPAIRVRVSSGVVAGNIAYKVNPKYPEDAKRAHIEGAVVLHVIINKAGEPTELALISGPPELAPAAIEAVRQWRYQPYKLNGEPVEVETTLQINFTLLP